MLLDYRRISQAFIHKIGFYPLPGLLGRSESPSTSLGQDFWHTAPLSAAALPNTLLNIQTKIHVATASSKNRKGYSRLNLLALSTFRNEIGHVSVRYHITKKGPRAAKQSTTTRLSPLRRVPFQHPCRSNYHNYPDVTSSL
ncbi:hypothetical protein ABKN59_002511 [Abortiporus biennis]